MIENLLKYMSAKNCRKRLSFDFHGQEEATAATLPFSSTALKFKLRNTYASTWTVTLRNVR